MHYKELLYLFFFFIFISFGYSVPLINSATGTFIDGNIITLKGSSFQQGPHVIVFDNFNN